VQLTASVFCFHYHVHSFNTEEAGHFTFSAVYLLLIILGVFAGIFGTDALVNNSSIGFLFGMMMIMFVVVVFFIKSETVHQEHLDKMFKHIQDQRFLKLVLDTHNEGLLVLNSDCQITFSN